MTRASESLTITDTPTRASISIPNNTKWYGQNVQDSALNILTTTTNTAPQRGDPRALTIQPGSNFTLITSVGTYDWFWWQKRGYEGTVNLQYHLAVGPV